MEELAKLGFSPSEIKVYLQLVHYGANYANKISKETKLNRTNVYEALDRLVGKGVISFITRNKVKWFEANSSNSLLTLVEAKQEDLEKTKQNLAKLIKPQSPDAKHLEATIFVGKKGLRMLFEEILEVAKPISLIAAQLQFKKFFGPYFELWHKQRMAKKISQRSIFPESFKNKLPQRQYLKYKFVDNKFTNPTTTIIYGSTCLFIQWGKEPLAIKMGAEIARSHLNYFNMLWGQ